MRVTSSVDGLARRWYSHRYNRPDLYGLAARLGWLPRRVRLALARQIGRLAPRLIPAERAAIRKTLAHCTNTTGSRLDALTARVFVDFAMCFSDLVSTNRKPRAQLAAYVAGRTGWSGSVDSREASSRSRRTSGTGSWPGDSWPGSAPGRRMWSWRLKR